MKYRSLRAGETVLSTDEYIGVFSNNKFIPVAKVTVGKVLLPCNVKYYRRAISEEAEKA